MFVSTLWFLLAGCSPTHPAGEGLEDALLTFSGGRIECLEGSVCAPLAVELPLEAATSLEGTANAIIGYDCNDESWEGLERVHEFTLPLPGTLDLLLDAGEGLGAFLVSKDEDYRCLVAGHAFSQEVAAGDYWLVIDSKPDAENGAYSLWADFTEIDDSAIADAYEPNDDAESAAPITLEWGDESSPRATLTPASPVDYYTFDLDPLGQFYFEIEDANLDFEMVSFDAPLGDPEWFTSDDNHVVELEDPWANDGGEPFPASVTVRISAKSGFVIPAEGYEYRWQQAHYSPF